MLRQCLTIYRYNTGCVFFLYDLYVILLRDYSVKTSINKTFLFWRLAYILYKRLKLTQKMNTSSTILI